MAVITKKICYNMTPSINIYGNDTTTSNTLKWASSSYLTQNTVSSTAYGGLGRNLENSYRSTVIKFTTPSSIKTTTNRRILVTFNYRSNSTTATNSGTLYYRISKTGPNFSTNSPQFPAADASGVFSGTKTITFTTTEQRFELETNVHAFETNTTYYMWLISEPPKGGGIGYIRDIWTYFQVDDSVEYTKAVLGLGPNYHGFYSGAKLIVEEYNGAGTGAKITSGHIYATSGSGAFYRHNITYNSDTDSYVITLSTDTTTTTTTKTIRYFYSPEDIGSTVTYHPQGQLMTYDVIRFVCRIYSGVSTPKIYNCRDHSNINPTSVPDSSYTLDGMATSEMSTSASISLPLAWSSAVDGKTYYCIYNKDLTSTYYRGHSSQETATATEVLYGTGQKTLKNIKLTSDYNICGSNETYQFKGFAKNANSTSVLYNTIEQAIIDTRTFYGIYFKDFEAIAKSGVLKTGGADKTWSLNQTAGTKTFYGTGQLASTSTLSYDANVSYNGNIPYTTISPTGDMKIGGTNYYELDTTLTALEKANDGDTIIVEYEGTDTLTYLDMDGTIYDQVTLKVLVNDLLHGTKVKLIPSESYPVAYQPPNNNKFLGWYDAYGDKLNFTYDSYYADWTINDMSIRQVSPKLELANDIYYGKNGEWKKAKIYKGINGQWVPVLMRYGKNSEWKNDYSYFDFTAFGARVAYNGQTWADWLASDMNVDYRLQLDNNEVVCEVTSMGLVPIIREGSTDDIYGTDKIIEDAVYKTTL